MAGTVSLKPSSRNGRAIGLTVDPINNQFVTFDYYSFNTPEPPSLEAGEVYFIGLRQDYGNQDFPAKFQVTFWGDPDNGGTTQDETGSIMWKTDANYWQSSLPADALSINTVSYTHLTLPTKA